MTFDDHDLVLHPLSVMDYTIIETQYLGLERDEVISYIKNIIDILKAIFIANKNSKKIKKEDKKYESNRINTKHHGNNA